MELQNLVVARYADGRVLKGVTHDFNNLRPTFHVELHDSKKVVEILVRQLKALFFVKSFDGHSEREDVPGFIDGPAENSQGRKIAVRFRDGEFLCGYATSWSPERPGFFLFPADRGSNNDRVWVVSSAAIEVKAGPQAEALAQRILADPAARRATGTFPRPAVPGPGPAQGGGPAGQKPKPPGPPRSNAA